MKKKSQKLSLKRTLFYLGFVLILSSLIGVACTKDQFGPDGSDNLDQDLIELSMDLPEVQAVMRVQKSILH